MGVFTFVLLLVRVALLGPEARVKSLVEQAGGKLWSYVAKFRKVSWHDSSLCDRPTVRGEWGPEAGEVDD